MDKLTEKQKRFCDYYIETLNATESAKRAGYSEKTAQTIGKENLTKPLIKSYIGDIMNKERDNRIASREEVLEFLTSVMRQEKSEEVVVTESKIEGGTCARIINKKAGIKDANKAGELLAKRYGLLTENINLEGNLNVSIVDDIGSDEE